MKEGAESPRDLLQMLAEARKPPPPGRQAGVQPSCTSPPEALLRQLAPTGAQPGLQVAQQHLHRPGNRPCTSSHIPIILTQRLDGEHMAFLRPRYSSHPVWTQELTAQARTQSLRNPTVSIGDKLTPAGQDGFPREGFSAGQGSGPRPHTVSSRGVKIA